MTLLLVAALNRAVVAAPAEGASSRTDAAAHTVDDPMRDGWSTEVLQSAAQEQLDRIAQLLSSPRDVTGGHFDELLAGQFACTRLRPADLQPVFHDSSLLVLRPSSGMSTRLEQHEGDGFAMALRELARDGAGDTRAKFKVFRIEPGEDSFITRQLFTLFQRGDAGGREVHSIWRCRWSHSSPADRPRLLSVELEVYEESVARSSSGTLFADCTESVFGSNASFAAQLVFGLDYWNDRLPHIDTDGMQGLAVGDANGDGLDDVYICQIASLPNRLFLQNPDGTVTDHSAESGVDWMEPTHSALFIDLDNDGDQDLLVSTVAVLIVMENDGTGKFAVRSTIPEARDAYSLSAADYDQDGDLDVFACVYLAKARRRQILAAPVPFHDARNGGRNVLLRNEGVWRLADVTREAGLEAEATRRSFASSWEDYDNDGDLDLYVANDYGRNNLFRNDHGRFTDVAGRAGVEDQSFGMSASWGDFNRDGWMDLYVSNMFSAAGNRIVFQRQFKAGEDDDVRRKFQYMARGNSLFQNTGRGDFCDVSAEAAVMMGYWAWGSQFVDLNNDGWEDIVVANGYLTRSDPSDL